jgi:two-component system, NarL family, invasion response regulator UvrY
MIRLFLVDDHELIREGLKRVLAGHHDLTVVGEAATLEELAQALSKTEIDIVILDITLQGRSGLEALALLKRKAPQVRVLVLTVHPEERYALRALKAGAAGYLNKQSAAAEMVTALRRIHSGRKYVSASLADSLANEVERGIDRLPHEILSDREFQIMRMIAMGNSSQQIAQELFLSVNTVGTYRSRLISKMKMRTNAEIVRYCFEHDLIE